MTNIGKIGRLPHHLREELNQRLQLRQVGTRLCQWLNSLPEVQAILARHFGGHKINPRNLREWKTRGFAQWQVRERFLTRAIQLHAAHQTPSTMNQAEWTGNLTPENDTLLELMNRNRPGKIARLPRELRNELNRRLRNGENGTRLLEWLNGLSEVQALLAREFQGRPINHVNLTYWKLRGYRDWRLQCDLAEKVRTFAQNGQTGNLSQNLKAPIDLTHQKPAGWTGNLSQKNFTGEISPLVPLGLGG